MARVKIETPKRFIFSTQCTVRVGDLNYGNHLANDKLLALLHQARVEFFASLGQSELNFYDTGLIMSDSIINYKSQAYLNDKLCIEVGLTDITRVAFDIVYRVTMPHNNTLVAEAKTGMVCFNYTTEKVQPVPSEVLQLLD